MYINGKWVEAQSKKVRDIINPYNQEVIASATEGDEEDTREAIRAARKAFDEGIWPTLAAHKSGELVYQIGTLIRRDLQELAEMETLDTGKTFKESLDDMLNISDFFFYFCWLKVIIECDMILSTKYN